VPHESTGRAGPDDRSSHPSDSAGAALGTRLRERDLSAAPATLNLLESSTAGDREQAAALMREVSPAALGGARRALRDPDAPDYD